MQVEPMVPLADSVIDDTSLLRKEQIHTRRSMVAVMVSNGRADAVGTSSRLAHGPRSTLDPASWSVSRVRTDN